MIDRGGMWAEGGDKKQVLGDNEEKKDPGLLLLASSSSSQTFLLESVLCAPWASSDHGGPDHRFTPCSLKLDLRKWDLGISPDRCYAQNADIRARML